MKLSQLSPGDQVQHYCCGVFVTATIIEVTENGAYTRHRAVKWAGDTYTNTNIIKGGSGVNPAIFYNGIKIDQ